MIPIGEARELHGREALCVLEDHFGWRRTRRELMVALWEALRPISFSSWDQFGICLLPLDYVTMTFADDHRLNEYQVQASGRVTAKPGQSKNCLAP